MNSGSNNGAALNEPQSCAASGLRRRLTWKNLLHLSDSELGGLDPVGTNLIVAMGIPKLAHLDILHYQRQCDHWATEVKRRLPGAEKVFWRTPEDWKNDVNFFRLGVLCGYLDEVVGIRYIDEQKNARQVRYTDPSDLFLNGVMDRKQGTCGNMAMLHVAVAWRFGWPVSLACVGTHFICRYDDGVVTHNIEATHTGRGGFSSRSDEEYIREYRLSSKAITSGSDLRAVRPREMLGLFLGLRARHYFDVGNLEEAEKDFLLARHFFPNNHQLYYRTVGITALRGGELFDSDEEAHPIRVAEWLRKRFGGSFGWAVNPFFPSKETGA